MQIAELEQRTGVNRHTLRYYEKAGLLQEVERRGNNYRDYPEKAVERVGMVRQLKARIRVPAPIRRTVRLECSPAERLAYNSLVVPMLWAA